MSRARSGALVVIAVLAIACGGPIAASPSGASPLPTATLPASSEPASPAPTEMSSPTPSATPVPTTGPSAPASSPVPTAAPTARPTPAPTPPAGTAAPPAPAAVNATWQVAACPDETGHGDIVLAHAVAATPSCIVVTLGWAPATGTNAVYRIFEAWSGEGAGAACDRAGATLIATSAPNVAAITVGPLPMNTGGGELCLYVAAANSAGESARVQVKGVSP
jgi:hypothetical protein